MNNKLDENYSCPQCECKDFYYKQQMSGVGNMYFRLDGEEPDNGDMHSGLIYRPTGKYFYCATCHKRLSKLEEAGIR